VAPDSLESPRRTAEDGGREGSVGWALAGLTALGASLFLWVRPTNFRGYDEWLIFSLLSRGIVGFPYARRPLNLVWALPAWALAPDRLWGFLLVHATWLTLGGILVYLLVRRLLPARRPSHSWPGRSPWPGPRPTRPGSPACR
jgi:hypothetical protein